MSLATLALLAGTFAAVPVLALAVLAVIGAADTGAAAAAIAAVFAGAFGLALLAVRDLGRFIEGLHRAEQGDFAAGIPGRAGSAFAGIVYPPFVELAREAERVLRTLDGRAARAAHKIEADAAIIELLPDPLIVLGIDRAIMLTNAAARSAFGTELSALLRHPLLRAAIDRAAAAGGSQRAELALPAPVPRELDAAAIPLPANGAPAGSERVLLVLSDRTRERAIERMRADFVANASHELRTPLASLAGFIETLRGPAAEDPPAQQRFLGIMAEQAERMNRLIDDLLSLSRIELIEHQPPCDRVDLGVLIDRLAAAFEPRLGERGMVLERAVAPDLPEVPGDADQLVQVLQNLLDNAVKYGAGSVRVAASPAPPGRWPARPGVVIAVADDGPGIPREHLPRLTERFYRVDKGRSRRAGGTGLGLAIVKHIVNRHRGQLVIESEEGRGSTFSVWLPLER
jgi:two-component system phosphate regulon sensor histidine kinase PhoR